MEHYVDHALSLAGRKREILPQTFVDVFHVDDGIIDQRSDGDGDTTEAHGVYAETHEMEQQHAYDYGQRKRYKAHDGGAQVHQEEKQHDDYKKRPFEQRALKVAYRPRNEVALAEYVCRHFQIGRKRMLHVGKCGLYTFGKRYSALIGLFSHSNDNSRFGFDGCGAEAWLCAGNFHTGHIGKRNDAGGVGSNDGHGKFVGVGGAHGTFYYIFVAEIIDDSARGIVVQPFDGFHHFGQRDTHGSHSFGENLNAVFAHVAAYHAHLAHAAHGQQARTDYFFSQCAELEQRCAVGCKADYQHFAENGRTRAEHRAGHTGR